MRAVRHFLLPIAAAAVVAACGGEGSSNTPPSSSGPRAGNPSMQPQRTLQMPVPERSSSLRGMDAPQRREVLALFPELAQGMPYPGARLTLKRHEARVLLSA